MSHVNINGKTYNVPDGKSISIINDQLYVDGKPYGEKATKSIEIVWNGQLASLTVQGGNVTCGNVDGDVRADGSVDASCVSGNVAAGGSVKCTTVDGNVNAGGSVKCEGAIGGNVNAGGSVKSR